MDDRQLLSEYLATGSQAAFTALVGRNLGLVYSAARRQVGEGELAHDVTQAVFMLLAGKASSIAAAVPISAWLLRTTRYAANNALKMKRRREHHEREAAKQRLEASAPEAQSWAEVSPHLDGAIDSLGQADRSAIVLRYFENKPLAAVGAALGISADAAEKRVSRAVEKLRAILSGRGVTLGAAVIGALLGANAVQAAPAGLETSLFAPSLTPSSIGAQTLAQATWQAMNAGRKRLLAWGGALAALLLLGVGITWIWTGLKSGTIEVKTVQLGGPVVPVGGTPVKSSAFVEVRRLASHPAGAYHLAFLADGQMVTAAPAPLILGSYGVPGSPSVVRIMGLDGLKETRRLNIDFAPITAFAISSDGRTVAVAGGETDAAASVIRIVSMETPTKPVEISGHKGAVTALSFVGSGRKLISASADRTMLLWDLDVPDKPRSLSLVSEVVTAVAVSPDGLFYSYAEGKKVRVIELSNDLCRHDWVTQAPVRSIVFSADSKKVLWADEALQIRGLSDQQALREPLQVSGGRLAIAADGLRLLVLCEDNTVRLYRRE